MLDSGLVKRSLHAALLWRLQEDERHPDCQCVYMPLGVVSSAIDRAVATLLQRSPPKKFYSLSSRAFTEDTSSIIENYRLDDQMPHGLTNGDDTHVAANDISEQIDDTPQDTPRSKSLPKIVSTKRSLGVAGTPDVRIEPLLVESEHPHRSYLFSSRTKRRRMSVSKKMQVISKSLSESVNFTKKLEALLCGGESIDLIIGNGTSFLSEALENASPLITEFGTDQSDIRALRNKISK
jgi:hypothetical protein